MSMMVVSQLTPVPLNDASEKVTVPPSPGGEGSRFFSLRRNGVAGSGNGGIPSPALRRCGAALGGMLALGFFHSSSAEAPVAHESAIAAIRTRRSRSAGSLRFIEFLG